MGYPAGIGPEIILRSLASPQVRRLANFLVIGDESVFRNAARLIKRGLRYSVICTSEEIDFSKAGILFLDLKNVKQDRFCFGRLSKAYGKASIEYLEEAMPLLLQHKADLLVTAPIHKHAAELSGFSYHGHTEYLAHWTKTKNFAMMLIGGPLKVILVTTHLPLKAVPKRLRQGRIFEILTLADSCLKRQFDIRRPHIAVCGLNPHAGEGGLLGSEEETIIAPAIKKANAKGINAYGPVASDAVFYDMYKGRYDATVCMYHDQGLVALKMLARDESVNITLGLPFIRTSPGHGTALDVAKKGVASAESMKQAIRTAVYMYKGKPC